MKRIGHTIILLLLAAVVFYTGTGVTVMKYCCSNCKASYSILGQKHTCMHPEEANESGLKTGSCPMCSGVVADENNVLSYTSKSIGCEAARISVDLDLHQFRAYISVPFVWLSDIEESSFGYNNESVRFSDLLAYSEPPPNIIPRTYLSMIQVLII